ncbi:glycoside hydrolase family 16 protein [Pholiota conissans]|uniref:Glycoside hydrolase family 16 protein n=1 Tax=Pholiota conissans TaxID=109636 RepID=A0A9P6D0S0_9AGAR|nr:glycoside hydrolase family 16 protein [Pholiota conissans]
MKSIAIFFFFLGSSLGARLPRYTLSESIIGYDFLEAFDFQAITDPTHGRVNYLSRSDALSKNLVKTSRNSFIMRADYTTILSPDGPGRDSVRIISKKTYNATVMIFEMRHMPEGCGTWPAIRTKQASPPNTGIIDILEGVNNQRFDQVTLHTSGGCTVPPERSETGIAISNNCDVGCSVGLYNSSSFGPSFNSDGGGWYAMERTADHVKVWFWKRKDHFIPVDVLHSGPLVNPLQWGTPAAYFPNTSCDMEEFLTAHNILINLTLCGDWAGSTDVYAASGCPSTCVDHANNDPTSFRNALFDFAAIRIYTPM